MPVYNVEAYLGECLDSILGQPYGDVEVVLVDDGSTDASATIASRFAAADPRVRLVSQANAGLGAARNAGVAAARGEFLTFVDSDDRLPVDAWSAMMRTLATSGSDFAIGKLVRDEGARQFATPRMRENHRVRRVGVTLDEMPRILADVFAVNKIFRRSFWDEAGLAFPTGVRYEDQPTLTRAFLAAERFDVLTATVYLWRVRTDGSSITQRRHDIGDLHDRILTKRSSTEVVLAQAPHLLGLWRSDILPVDMWEYFGAVPGCTEEYWDLLRSAVAEFWSDDTVPFHECAVPVQFRLMGWYVAQDRRADLERLVAFVDEHGRDLPTEQREDHVVALLPGVDQGTHPRSTYVLEEHDLRWEARVTEAGWEGARLQLRGFALIRNAPPSGRDTSLSARLVGPDGLSRELSVAQLAQPGAMTLAGRPRPDLDGCGFALTVDAGSLPVPSGTGPGTPSGTASWRLRFERRVGGLVREGGVTSFDRAGVDRDWHEVSGTAGTVTARLRPLDGGLVLDLHREVQ